MAELDAPVSVKAYARHRAALGLVGATPNAIRKAIKAGRLSASVSRVDHGHWKIAAAAADAEWNQNTEPAKASARMASATGNVGGAPRKRSPAPLLFGQGQAVAEQPNQNGRNQEQLDLLKATRIQRTFEAQLKRLKYEREAGGLVESAEVTTAAHVVWKRVRDRLLSIADRLDAQLAAMTDADKINETLVREITEAMAELVR